MLFKKYMNAISIMMVFGSAFAQAQGPDGYNFAADEGETVTVSDTVDIAYGADGAFNYLRDQSTNVACTNEVFGDPIFGTVKACYTKPASVAMQLDQCNTTQQCMMTYGDGATDCFDSRSDQSICLCGSERCDAIDDGGDEPIVDQCNTTQQCQATYGSGATDCFDSRSDQSLCMCGSQRCDGIDGGDPGQSGTLGQFNLDRDFLLACYDNLPDVDDLHSMAAFATMLRDDRFANLDYFAVVGCRGNQPSHFKLITNTADLANLAFAGNWARAQDSSTDTRGGSLWRDAVDRAVDRAMPKLNSGGHLWVADAGQSDFSADVVREIVRRNSAIDTDNIHVIQHSQWNQNQTSSNDLNYLRDNVDYRKIADGNQTGNGTPGYKTNSDNNWDRLINNNQVGPIWQEARAVANEWNGIKNGHNNTAIRGGGFDFSDTSEMVYIFGLMGETPNVNRFFDEFL